MDLTEEIEKYINEIRYSPIDCDYTDEEAKIIIRALEILKDRINGIS